MSELASEKVVTGLLFRPSRRPLNQSRAVKLMERIAYNWVTTPGYDPHDEQRRQDFIDMCERFYGYALEEIDQQKDTK